MTGAKILIIEDEAIFAMHISRMLSRMGCHICGHASTGEQALALARETNPDLFILDIGLMGAMDGIETAKKLRESTQSPIVFMTGYAGPEVVARALAIENTHHLPKPVQDAKLQNIVQGIKVSGA